MYIYCIVYKAKNYDIILLICTLLNYLLIDRLYSWCEYQPWHICAKKNHLLIDGLNSPGCQNQPRHTSPKKSLVG